MLMLNDVAAVILGGGRGSRLYPLTQQRSKPAVPIAGKYRLIDVPISNCINSGITRIAVLTQFNSASLHRHIAQTYTFDKFHTGWVEILAAEQTPDSTDWYQGTADAVRKQLLEIRSIGTKYLLILAGDHLYRMDYAAMARFHWEMRADVTLAVKPIGADDVTRFGIVRRGPGGRLVDFAEKPTDPTVHERFATHQGERPRYLASMGIYIFRTEALLDLLAQCPGDDFGKELIPFAIGSHSVYGYDFDGFWEDIGTIRSFYETNLVLTRPAPPFSLFDPARPIYTRARFLPGSVIFESELNNVLLAEGSTLSKATVSDSIIGLRSIIREGTVIRRSIVMGADYYADDLHRGPGPGIGPGCHIEGAIIDKNAHIGPGVTIRPFPPGTDLEGDRYVVRDGIVVIAKNSVVPEGSNIGPAEDGGA